MAYLIRDMDGNEVSRSEDARTAWASAEARWPGAETCYRGAHGAGMSALYDLANHAAVDGELAIIVGSEGERVGTVEVWTIDSRRLALIDLGLSPQEAAVVARVEAGERMMDIAAALGITRQAATNARRRGYGKLRE